MVIATSFAVDTDLNIFRHSFLVLLVNSTLELKTFMIKKCPCGK